MRKKIKKFILKSLNSKKYHNDFQILSYSQGGEDTSLYSLFFHKKDGFYVDVGAHDPYIYSNTCLFYKLGWSGINIDALPGTKKIFDKERKRDINLEMGVSEEKGNLDFYMFNEPAFNTFSEERSKEVLQNYKNTILKEVKKVPTDTLGAILNKYLPAGEEIDFLSIDVEGLDFEVLKSNDWNKYKPKVIVVEIHGMEDICDVSSHPIYKFLKKQGYNLFAKTFFSFIFKSQQM